MIRLILLMILIYATGAPVWAASTHIYCRNGAEVQRLDLYPRQTGTPARGTIVYFHGGGYSKGSRTSGFELRRAGLLTAWGFDLASIDYRLAPRHRFPAQLEDARCALGWLRGNARRLGIDAGWIGLMGDSAGGHLAALIGVLGRDDIGAVAAFYAPLDIENAEPDTLLPIALQAAFPTQVLRRQWNPIRHVDKRAPPFLLVHGKADSFVSVAQSVRFAVRLKEAGHDPKLAAVERAEHGLLPKGGTPNPDAGTLDRLLVAFFVGMRDR